MLHVVSIMVVVITTAQRHSPLKNAVVFKGIGWNQMEELVLVCFEDHTFVTKNIDFRIKIRTVPSLKLWPFLEMQSMTSLG